MIEPNKMINTVFPQLPEKRLGLLLFVAQDLQSHVTEVYLKNHN